LYKVESNIDYQPAHSDNNKAAITLMVVGLLVVIAGVFLTLAACRILPSQANIISHIGRDSWALGTFSIFRRHMQTTIREKIPKLAGDSMAKSRIAYMTLYPDWKIAEQKIEEDRLKLGYREWRQLAYSGNFLKPTGLQTI
jgi:hypothetical protein